METSSSPTAAPADFWKRKLAAFLHDTPTKCLNIREHQEKSHIAMSRAGFTAEEIGCYDYEADWAAAAADRYPFPTSRASGLSCAFDGHRNQFHHPLGGTKETPAPQLGFTPIASDALGSETEQVCQPLLETGQPADPDFWRDRCFAHWRLWCRDAREKDHRLAFLPADTRIPDHTIWNHMQVVSALAGANTDGGPAFLRLQIGGVQEFIGQARNTRDLWSGSYLLSWLMVAGLKDLTSRIGPDAVVFPNLLGQPLFDLQWRDEIWNELRAQPNAPTVWQGNPDATGQRSGLDAGPTAQLTPNFPNVFLALVPANQAAALGQSTADVIREELKSIAACVWNHALTAGILKPDDRSRFDSQIARFLNITWQAEPWPAEAKPQDGSGLDAACALATNAPSNSPLATAAVGVAAIRHMAEHDMPLKDRDSRYYIGGKDGPKQKLNNTGLAWSILVAHQQAQLDAVRQTRVFSPSAEGGWTIGSHNTKDALIGRDEALIGGAELHARCSAAGEGWSRLFKKNDPVAALTLLKRTWHIAYLHDVWKFPLAAFKMPNTRGIAAHEPFSDSDTEDDVEDIPPSEKYFAVLALDGDEIGKWVSGAKTPPIADQLAHYADGSGNLTEGSLPYFKRQCMAGFLASRRALSPSYHLQFSEALSAFALHCARPIVEAFDGRLIYAGGDDVVALLPADSALRCAEALRAAFQGSSKLPQLLAASPHPPQFAFTSPAPGFLARSDSCDHHQRGTPIPFIVPGPAAEVSVGLAIAHFKSPLQDVVRAAQASEKRAKNALGRAAVSLRLMKRSGEILDWGSKWDGGGLALYHAIAHALDQKQLTGKFPHRLCEILSPFINETEAVTDLADFPVAEVIRREFSRLLRQHEDTKWDATSAALLTTALEAYLATLAKLSASAAAQDLTALCTAVAFAHRTR
jgi:hypothetical protein